MGRIGIRALLLFCCLPAAARAQARFDLTGPNVDVRVTRNGTTLPIAAVPNLQPGDQLWVHPALPPTQSVHYLLIVAFLRGTTNPPPESWFTRVETWKPDVRAEGVNVIVPAEAEQALLFLAPETGGDFSTLRSAVRGRPGVFVRASQDLTEAGFEQGRIDKYLASMMLVPPSDQAALVEHSNLLARTLNLKPNVDCFKRPLDQQYNCLTQTGTQTLLDDGHGQSMVAALSTGAGSDFINTASTTRLAGSGEYSAYVGAIVDLARIMNSIHTAQYQYIPGLALPEKDALALRLNTPPSFHNPKSVIVISLPAIQKAVPPPLRPADPHHVSCLLNPHLVLPVEGAPLVFTTGFAHNLVLHPDGGGKDLPLTADAFQGGLQVSAQSSVRRELPLGVDPDFAPAPPAIAAATPVGKEPLPAAPGAIVHGTIQGFWGFDRFTGPTLLLQQTPGQGWHIVQQEAQVIAGQPNHVQLLSSGTACVASIALEPGDKHLEWKRQPAAAGASSEETRPVDVALNLQKEASPGNIQLSVQQFGVKTPDRLDTRAFSEPATIGAVRVHAGDLEVLLTGKSLEQVKSLTLHDTIFLPRPPEAAAAGKTLTFAMTNDAKAPSWKAGEHLTGAVQLQDGRSLPVAAVVEAARPSLMLLSRRVTGGAPSAIRLASPNDLPLGATMDFFLKSKTGFPRAEKIQIAQVNAPEGEAPLETMLSVAGGTLILQDAHTVLATFDPLKTFGPSTFGAFQMRAIAPDGTEGEWIPLARIVRLPALTAVTCPADITFSCSLTGSSLFLLDAVATNAGFSPEIKVPEGFVEQSLAMPRPDSAGFFLKLRDDPDTAQFAVVPVTVLPQKHQGAP